MVIDFISIDKKRDGEEELARIRGVMRAVSTSFANIAELSQLPKPVNIEDAGDQ